MRAVFRRFLAVCVLLTGATQPALAAAPAVRITKLVNVSLLSIDVAADAISSQNICIFRNAGSGGVPGGYIVTASGSGPSSAFSLAAPSIIPLMPYSVLWNDSIGQTTGTALTATVANAGHITTQTASSTCASAPTSTASLIIKVLASDLQAAVGGATYTGTLTLLIAPQ